MALQAGMGVSRLLFLVGAGYTGTILFKNGKLNDVVTELQALAKGMDTRKSDSSSTSFTDDLASHVSRLAMEVRQLASTRQITVLNGTSSTSGNVIISASALGLLGYGYLRWKGLSLFDLMFVTKRNMSHAVENLSKNLGNLSDKLGKTRQYLAFRVDRLDEKIDQQADVANEIKDDVGKAKIELEGMGKKLNELTDVISRLGLQICTVDEKQDAILCRVDSLWRFVDGRLSKDDASLGAIQGSYLPKILGPEEHDCDIELVKRDVLKFIEVD